MNIMTELSDFLKELKSYDRMLRRDIEPSDSQKRYVESLRQKLVRMAGSFKNLVIQITGKQYYTQFGRVTDFWSDGLIRSGDLSIRLTSLGFIIDAVIECLGMLEEEIKQGHRDAQGNVIGDLQSHLQKQTTPTEEINVLFDKMQFHQEIVKASQSLFKNGHYAQAIFEAFKAVNSFVKKKTKCSLDGKALMAEVFRDSNPILKLNDLKTQSDKDEQEGFRFLFMGAMVGIRNPKAHDMVEQEDPYKTLEYLAFASMLMKKIGFWEVV